MFVAGMTIRWQRSVGEMVLPVAFGLPAPTKANDAAASELRKRLGSNVLLLPVAVTLVAESITPGPFIANRPVKLFADGVQPAFRYAIRRCNAVLCVER